MDFANIKKVLDVRCPDLIDTDGDRPSIMVKPESWGIVSNLLKTDPDLTFDSLMCLSGFDLVEDDHLGVAYHFYSMDKRHDLEVIIRTPKENPSIPSIANIWRAADWHEREAYDMYGIIFEGHPDLKRILLPDDWEGFPLRKDYVQADTYQGIIIKKDKTYWK
ncbi:MAG: NADH-quinone oxidoreductase subunit C [Candidatus Marinimicrobia bacterium]|nr:NADH-quinone oxidoreductase subunit C [Candidatus Neomarinimicrobiota bacterium]